MADENPSGDKPTEALSQADTDTQEGASLEGSDEQAVKAEVAITSPETKKPKKGGVKALFRHFSIYLLLFVFVVVIAVIVVAISYLRGHTKPTGQISSQTLPQSSVSQLASSDVTVGDVKQTLNVQSNAVFAGQVLIRKDLEVAGKLQVGGDLSLTGVTVSGSSIFDTAQINKNLTVAGDTALQGQLSIQKGITVNGSGTFSGVLSAPQLSVNTLQLNGDLLLTHHISAGGATPARTNGSALGGGGTTSVSGSDTAGSITINTGGSPVAGCFVTVTFTTKFNTTPHVVVTPVEAAAAGIAYYVTRTTTGFTVCTATSPPAGQAFGYDYIVLD